MSETELFYATLPFALAWVGWVSKTISAHTAVIERLDKLVDLMLEERLSAKDQNRREA